jgi:hypothetical protein
MESPLIIRAPLSSADVLELAGRDFGDMIKVVVDIKRGIMAAGGELHADSEALLVNDGSAEEDIWGANFYPEREPGKRLEYSAMLNIRPAHGNRSQDIGSEKVRTALRAVVERLMGAA